MSSSIDQRIVEMQFDNQQFEQGIGTSLKSLDKLNESLSFKGADKGLLNIQNGVKAFDVTNMLNAVGSVGTKFNTLEIAAITAVSNIANRITNLGLNLAKQLSFIGQWQAGWSKFEEKTSSVKTIMSATGKSVEEVSRAMEALNWFTDETSYNFTDMASNIGKFTANKVDLETANIAMQGIATWAALAGQNASAASRAMYNISQAIGVGSVKLMDWRSIENANMATSRFKETALETAVDLGVLKKSADGTFKTLKGVSVTVESFSQSLATGWFNKDVLLATLEKFGGFAINLQKAVSGLTNEANEAAFTATDLLGVLKEFEDTPLPWDKDHGSNWFGRDIVKGEDGIETITYTMSEFADTSSEAYKKLKQQAEDYGVSVEELGYWIQELNSEENALGKEAFIAAQEAKTLSDAIGATKDAVSTGWMNTFEKIFGNYEEAADWWTYFTNDVLWELFASGDAARNSMLGLWKAIGGRDKLLGDENSALRLLLDNLVNIVDTVNSSAGDFLSPLGNGAENGAKKLLKFTESFQKLAEWLYLSDERLEQLGRALKIVWAPFNLLKTGLSAVASSLSFVSDKLSYIVDYIFEELASAGDFVDDIIHSITDPISNSLKDFGSLLNSFEDVKAALDVISGDKGRDNNGDLIFGEQKISDAQKYLDFVTRLQKVANSLNNIFGAIIETAKTGVKAVADFFKGLSPIWKDFILIGETILDILGPVGESIKNLAKNLQSSSIFFDAGSALADIIHFLVTNLIDFINVVRDTLGDPINKIIGYLKSAKESVSEFVESLRGPSVDEGTEKVSLLSKALGYVKKVLDYIKDIISKINFDSLIEIWRTIIEQVGGLAKTLIEAGKETLVNGDLVKNIVSIFTGIMSGQFLSKGGKLFDNLSGLLDSGKSFTDKLKESIEGLVSFIVPKAKEVQASLNPDMLFKLASALAILAGSLFIIASIDSDKLIGAIAAIDVLVVILNRAVSGFTVLGNNKGFSNFKKNSTSLIKIAAAILILAIALQKISKIDTESIAVSLFAMQVLFQELSMFANSMSKNKNSFKGMISAAASMLIFAASLRSLGSMDLESIKKSLLTMGAILLELITFANATNGSSLKGGQLIAVALSLIVFAGALKVLAGIDPSGLIGGLAAIGVLLLEIGVAASSINAVKLAGLSAALIIFGAGLAALLPGLLALSAMPLTKMGKALLVLVGIMAVLGVASKVLGSAVPGIIAFSGALAAFGLATILVGAGLVAISAGILSLTTTLVGGSAEIVAALQIIVSGLVGAIATFLASIVDGTTLIVEAVVALGMALFEAVKQLIPGLLDTIVTVLDAIRNYVPKIVDSVIGILVSVMDSIGKNMFIIVEAALNLIIDFFNALAVGIVENSDAILNAIKNILGAILYLLMDAIGELLSLIPGVGPKINKEIEKLIEPIKEEVYSAGIETTEGVANSIDKGLSQNGEPVKKAVDNFIDDSILGEFSGLPSKMQTQGELADEGFAKGLDNKLSIIRNKASLVAKTAVKTVNKELQIKSPSRVMMKTGMYIDMGLAEGIDRYKKSVRNSSGDIGKDVFNSIYDPISKISDSLNDDTWSTPIITPIVDTSSVERESNYINSLFNQDYAMAFSGGSFGRKLANSINIQNGNGNLLASIGELNDNISTLKESVSNQSIVLDSGALVGHTASKIDAALGRLYSYKERGN